jgi:hypothetical protein
MEVNLDLKIVFSFFAALALSACVLQSPKPNFDDQAGQSLLGKSGGTYATFFLERDKWTPEKEPMVFVPVNRHYIINTKGKPTQVLFVPISNQWWLAQFRDGENDTGYVFANVQPDAIYFHPLTCDNLKLNGTAAAIVTFRKDDCILAAGTSTGDFKSLIQAAGQRSMKLVLKK